MANCPLSGGHQALVSLRESAVHHLGRASAQKDKWLSRAQKTGAGKGGQGGVEGVQVS